MSRYNGHLLFRHIVTLLAIPLVLTGTGYALFSQELSINTTTNNPSYTISNNLLFTYTKVLGTQGQQTTFDFVGTVTNQGTEDTASWQVSFDVPADFGSLSCENTVACSDSGSTVTVNSGAGNGAITPGNSVSFTFAFTSYSTDYTLQNIFVAGTTPAVYQTIPGFTASSTHTTPTKVKGRYISTYTFTITNNSGNDVTDWQILAPWDSNNLVSSMDNSVNYVVTATELTILSTSGVTDGSSFQFSATFDAKTSAWELTGYTLEGVT